MSAWNHIFRELIVSKLLRTGIQLGWVVAAFAAVWPAAAAERGAPPPSECPQPRFTGKAPPEFWNLPNPVGASAEAIAAGGRIYRGKAGATACVTCHGDKGDGKGKLAMHFEPPPRNFACAQILKDIPDGHLFWIIRNGSPGTAMPPISAIGSFTDQEIWQVVAYIRNLAR